MHMNKLLYFVENALFLQCRVYFMMTSSSVSVCESCMLFFYNIIGYSLDEFFALFLIALSIVWRK